MNEDSRWNLDMGVDVGCADLILSKRVGEVCHFLYLELKRKKGSLSDSQVDWNADFDERFRASNCVRDVAYGYSRAVEAVEQWLITLQGDLFVGGAT